VRAKWIAVGLFVARLPLISQTSSLAPPADVAAPSADAQEAASGVFTKVLRPGTGAERPEGDDCIGVRFTSWTRDGQLTATSGASAEPAPQCLGAAMKGIAIALRLMTPGERRRVWIPADLSYKPEEAPQGPALTVEVELVSITRAPRCPQDLTAPPQRAQKLLSGVTIDWLISNKGEVHPAMDSKVTVHFSGWTASGKLFQTTVMDGQPATMPLGTALPGWREALPLLTPGDKVRVWIPAALAYGTKPPSKRIPAGNLVYEIELLKVD